MAVVKLVGKADNFDVVFEQNEQGLWETIVPFDEDGVYVLDLLAVDEAGNQSRYAKVLFIVDTSNIHCKFRLQILSFQDKTEQYDYGLQNNTSRYCLAVRRCDCIA